MLPEAKLKQLQELIGSSTKEELIWINGYLNGVVANQANPIAAEIKQSVTKKITLLYGTETGNSKSLAAQFAAQAKKHGIVAKIIGTDQYRLTDLPKEENLFVVISTHGEGEPPEAAKKFYDYIHQNELKLSSTKFSVLALGDTSYPIFCKTGEDVDIQLEKFGAKRIVPLQKCDVDYELDAQHWFNKVLAYLNQATAAVVQSVTETVPAKKAGKKTYEGTIIANINLHDKGSNKETYHIEIVTEEAVEFEAGDALAIIPNNKDFIVDTLLALTGTSPSTEVVTAKHTDTTRNLLINNLNICYLLNSTIKKYAAVVEKEVPDVRVDLIDLIKHYPPKNAEQFIEVIKVLSPIAPRLYTISSSPNVSNTEVHITVRRDEFVSHEDKRYGLCSNFLGDAELDTKLTFYIHKNKHFKLPTADKDIIMIGPGTGIAPFRSFLQERDATGATGKNWLFFGEHHFQKDFLYQTELQNHLQTEVLHNISLAFSRDQQEKIYVQHKMLEKGSELFSWVEKGATIYLSGTKGQMNIDVENAIVQVIEEHGNKSAEEAKAYWELLKKEGRYQKEVY